MIEKISKWLQNQMPFVVYRKPNEHIATGWFQQNQTLNKGTELQKSCFVFAPFAQKGKVFFYPEDCEILQETIVVKEINWKELNDLEGHNSGKEQHIQLVEKGVKAIQNGDFEKVVLSRKEEVSVNPNQYQDYYERFLQKYPTAFVYWFYHPEVGMWMGATPEQLLKTENSIVKTVALAGTMVDKGIDLNQVVWGDKERKEQQIVTDFIVDCLKTQTDEIRKTEPFTYKAGTLLHIKTDIEATLAEVDKVYDVIEKLHPTPALCGFPKQAAQDFIIENEGYHREYYGGFLGEWKFENGKEALNSDLFVNLRCMKIQGEKAYLFLGGGVNKDSDPESEYYETVNKSKTVKSIL